MSGVEPARSGPSWHGKIRVEGEREQAQLETPPEKPLAEQSPGIHERRCSGFSCFDDTNHATHIVVDQRARFSRVGSHGIHQSSAIVSKQRQCECLGNGHLDARFDWRIDSSFDHDTGQCFVQLRIEACELHTDHQGNERQHARRGNSPRNLMLAVHLYDRLDAQ